MMICITWFAREWKTSGIIDRQGHKRLMEMGGQLMFDENTTMGLILRMYTSHEL